MGRVMQAQWSDEEEHAGRERPSGMVNEENVWDIRMLTSSQYSS
jgi:hypothetical protein